MRLMDAYGNPGFRGNIPKGPKRKPIVDPPRFGPRTKAGVSWNRVAPRFRGTGTWSGIERGIQTFGKGKSWLPYARWGAVGGLGVIGLQNARRTFDSARNGDIGGTLVSGAMAGASLMGAYHYGLNNGSIRNHLSMAAKFVGPGGSIQQMIKRAFSATSKFAR